MDDSRENLNDAKHVALNAAQQQADVGELMRTEESQDSWVFLFGPADPEMLGGGAKVTVAKRDLAVLSVIGQQ